MLPALVIITHIKHVSHMSCTRCRLVVKINACGMEVDQWISLPLLLAGAATSMILSDKHNFVATKVLSQQAYFCRMFVATKVILVAAPANDIPHVEVSWKQFTDSWTSLHFSKRLPNFEFEYINTTLMLCGMPAMWLWIIDQLLFCLSGGST